jgi:hypothetical protein
MESVSAIAGGTVGLLHRLNKQIDLEPLEVEMAREILRKTEQGNKAEEKVK